MSTKSGKSGGTNVSELSGTSMEVFPVEFGGSVFRCEISRSRKSHRLTKLLAGVVPTSQFEEEPHAVEFVRRVWLESGYRGFMSLTLVMAGGLVVEIESTFDGQAVEVLDFRHDPEVIPAGIHGPEAMFDPSPTGRVEAA